MAISLDADLLRLSRFVANLSDAFSSFIFLPADLMLRLGLDAEGSQGNMLRVAAHHSLSQEINLKAALEPGCSLIGWVAKNKQPILVSLFDRDSRTLEVYSREEEIKSFLGVPIRLADGLCGVITVDSRKPYAFSKQQSKILEDFAEEVSNLISLHLTLSNYELKHASWGHFITQAHSLVNALGPLSIEVLRMRISNSAELEATLGCERLSHVYDQLFRLIQQTVPPHFPLYRTPTGDMVMVVDNMMTVFFQNKISALCDHLHSKGVNLIHEFQRKSVTKATIESSIESLIAETAVFEVVKEEGARAYGKRRS